MKQSTISFNSDPGSADRLHCLAELREDWESGRYRSLLIHVFSGLETEEYTLQVAARLRSLFADAQIVGTMSAGEIMDGRLMETGVLVSAVLFENTDIRVHRYDEVKGREESVGERIRRELDSIPDIKAAEILFPGTELDTQPLFRQLSLCRREIKIFGGYSGGHMMNAPVHFIFDESGIMYDSVFVTAFAGPDLHIDADKVIGWEPLGLPFRVTKADGNRLIELDGRPAAEIYERFLQIDRNRRDNAEEGYTFPLMAEYNGESWLRSAIHIESDGSMDLHGFVEEGTSIQLSYGNPLSIVDKVNRRLDEIREFRPQVIWLYSCIVRKAFWDSFVNIETEPFSKLAPTVGINSWGEVLRDEKTAELVEHNVTLLSVAMREGDAPEDGEIPEVKVDDSVLRGPAAQLRRMTSMVAAAMGELQKAHNDLRKMNEKLVIMAEHDALTGLYARGKTEKLISDELSQSAQSGQALSLIMVDVDHFKHVNDTYGHRAGDEVLKRIAELLQDTAGTAPRGAAGRWGGEEFFVVLPETDSAEAMAAAEKLRKTVENQNFPEAGRVTISLGVITPPADEQLRTIFAKVDNALYEAKENGRNRTVQA